ncbi:MAG: exodeoxyribonuclease III [Chromatiales bacterium]|nr:exodeoxyribonuclease III [Chromatiales bacterium]
MQHKTFKVASWNVNSIRSRLKQVLNWIDHAQADVLALQETKVPDEQFPINDIEAAGYQAIFSGQKSYNGVALLHRSTVHDTRTEVNGLDDGEKRVLAATINGIRIINLYVVNGSEVDSERYRHKLKWLENVCAFIKAEMRKYRQLIVLGDFNITPSDADVHDPKKWAGRILCSQAERQKLKTFFDLGLADTFRLFEHDREHSYSWWDYRDGSFDKNAGLRIDLLLASSALCECCVSSAIDRQPRMWERPSDHAPIVAEFVLQ